jgi:hypothetical protein
MENVDISVAPQHHQEVSVGRLAGISQVCRDSHGHRDTDGGHSRGQKDASAQVSGSEVGVVELCHSGGGAGAGNNPQWSAENGERGRPLGRGFLLWNSALFSSHMEEACGVRCLKTTLLVTCHGI